MSSVLVHGVQVGEVLTGQRAEVVRGRARARGGTVLVGPGGICQAEQDTVVTLCDTGDLAALMGVSPPVAFVSGGRCAVEAGTAWVSGSARVTLYDGARLRMLAGARPQVVQHGREVEVTEVSPAEWAAALAAGVEPQAARAGVEPDPGSDLEVWARPLTRALEAAGAAPDEPARNHAHTHGQADNHDLPTRTFRAGDPVAAVSAALATVDLPATTYARVSGATVTLTLAGALVVQVSGRRGWLNRR